MMSLKGFFYQFLKDGIVCIHEVQPQNGEVTLTFSGFPQYLGNNSSMDAYQTVGKDKEQLYD